MIQKFYIGILEADVSETPATQTATATAALGTGVTLTIPAPGSGLYQYLHSIIIEKVYGALPLVGLGALVVSTTNLGGIAWTFGHAVLSIGNQERSEISFPGGLRCAAPNTATTIVCPSNPQIVWRVSAVWSIRP